MAEVVTQQIYEYKRLAVLHVYSVTGIDHKLMLNGDSSRKSKGSISV